MNQSFIYVGCKGCDVYINSEHRDAGLEVKNVCELYYQRETGLEIISSVIQNIWIGDMTGATGVTGLEPDSLQVQVWN